jgi:hypothetical protein
VEGRVARRPMSAKRRAGVLTDAIGEVLGDAHEVMRMYEIHAAAEVRLACSAANAVVEGATMRAGAMLQARDRGDAIGGVAARLVRSRGLRAA